MLLAGTLNTNKKRETANMRLSWLSLGERLYFNQGITGSNPALDSFNYTLQGCEIVQTFGWIQTGEENQTIFFFPQIKKSYSFVYFSSALDTISKSSLESKPQGLPNSRNGIISTYPWIIKVSNFFISNDSHHFWLFNPNPVSFLCDLKLEV